MDLAALHDQLTDRAFLHDSPDAYLAGVNDALNVLTDDLIAAWDAEENSASRLHQ